MKKGFIFWVLLVLPLLVLLQACKPENDPPVEEPEEPVFELLGQVFGPGMHRYEFEGFRLDLIVTDTLHNPKSVFVEGEEFLIGFRVIHDFEGLSIRKRDNMFKGLGEVLQLVNDSVISYGKPHSSVWCYYTFSIDIFGDSWFLLIPWLGASNPEGSSECWAHNLVAMEPLEPGDYFTTLENVLYITCAAGQGFTDSLSFRVNFSVIENESLTKSGF
ncbi:MAG: hypothetical protein V2I46_02130 [Bacteroides sp.]|jgi:hypothetical protein|nr:hypothetical protein [Bacteroides sp.]